MDLSDMIADVRARLDTIGPPPSSVALERDDWMAAMAERRRRVDQLAEDLQRDTGAVIRNNSMGTTSIRLALISCNSTMGILGAVQNWLSAAERRVAQGTAA